MAIEEYKERYAPLLESVKAEHSMIFVQNELEKVIIGLVKTKGLRLLKGAEDIQLPESYQRDVVALDYLVTLFQLGNIIGVKKDMIRFTNESRINQIV